jgi:hypothetical protein
MRAEYGACLICVKAKLKKVTRENSKPIKQEPSVSLAMALSRTPIHPKTSLPNSEK